MFSKVLIANRGEIACRVIRTLNRLGCGSVAVCSEEDVHAMHVGMAGESVVLGAASARESYLSVEKVLDAARRTGSEAIHPGYGFLSENAQFAEACESAGIRFIGPTADQIRAFGLKDTARSIAGAQGVPLAPGSSLLHSEVEALAAAEAIGYPVMLKSTAGGGGIGLQRCDDPAQLRESFARVQRLSASHFGQEGVFLEKLIVCARHIEVQIFGDGLGGVVVLGERDCSAQRRHQKVIEETPAPGLSDTKRAEIFEAARRMGCAVNYRSAGTVEFVYDEESGRFYFLEVNTRLQVEHGVTELVTGIDLVEWMVLMAAGERPPMDEVAPPSGCSIQARVYAEDPNKSFQPSSGLITNAVFPDGARIDSWVESGTMVSPHYDPLLGKILVHGEDRDEAVLKLSDALSQTRIDGIETNLEFLRQVVSSVDFREARITTSMLSDFVYQPRTIDVLSPGLSTSIQDYPGRVGYWEPGIPPSGPMDHYSFRIGNRALGNPEGAAGLEITFTGPRLRFNVAATICVTGAACSPRVDGEEMAQWVPVHVEAGSVLSIGKITGAGCRSYVLVRGGLDGPVVMGSRSAFLLGGMGGLFGRSLRSGDVLHLADGEAGSPQTVPAELIPVFRDEVEVAVLYGPHAAPDYFLPEDIDRLLSHPYEVHYNSDRTGVRLLGPKPRWARPDGGEAGLHPSNIHDTMYAVGAIDFTGDMPIVLGVDGPSQGGFCCPAVVAQADFWKVGQLHPGSVVRFHVISAAEAVRFQSEQDAAIRTLASVSPVRPKALAVPPPDILHQIPAREDRPLTTYRMDGDAAVIVEYGPNLLDLTNRFRVQALLECLRSEKIPGVVEISPAVRSLQVQFDSSLLPLERLLAILEEAEATLPPVKSMVMQSRLVHLPLSWNDPQAVLAATKYLQSVRPSAPWCPDNIEFIRRVNGLASQQDVCDIVFGATYLVLGLGNVYLGAPCTTPLDPRHRLVTTKYNPARTWTPENAVGIGGAYLGIYGMEGPGGYQLVGRTCQIFNRYHTTSDFPPQHPWLLNSFDQIRFFPVSTDELHAIRNELPRGRYKVRMEERDFRAADYLDFLRTIRTEADQFERNRSRAFAEERQRWQESGEFEQQAASAEERTPAPIREEVWPEGACPVTADVSANVWKVLVHPGQRVGAGEGLVILEAMKMEIPVCAPHAGTVAEVRVEAGKVVSPGQAVVVLQEINPAGNA